MLKSGMTLTQIYSKYVEVSEELQKEKDESGRLGNYLEQIMKVWQKRTRILGHIE